MGHRGDLRDGLGSEERGPAARRGGLHRSGLYYDAVDAIRALEQAGDPLGPDLYLLKGEVLDRLGRLEEAREAFDRADALLRG